MIALILEWITRLLIDKKNKLVSISEVRTTWKKLFGFKSLNISLIIRNNFDIKPVILKLFFCSFLIDALLFALSAIANFIYIPTFFYNLFGCQISEINVSWPWIGILITNLLYVFFMVRVLSDCYKLSLRGSYRNNYSKSLFLDIFTLNIFNIIGILVFIKNKNQMLRINDNFKTNLNSQTIKNYSKLIIKIDIFILLINLMMLAIALVVGYFADNNDVKIVCLIVTVWNMFLIYAWSWFRIVNIIIVQKMLKTLLNSHDSYYLLSIIRFMGFMLGYYIAILITCLNLDEASKKFILENW